MSTTAAWTVSGAGNKIQIESGGTITANNIVATASFQVDNGGTYIHNAVSGAANGAATDVPGSATRTFGASSSVEFQKWANGGTGPVALPSGVAWGNVKINVATLAGSWQQSGTFTTVAGNLIIQSTGGTTREFRLNANSPTTSTLTVSGDVQVTGGILNITSGTAVETLNIGGNFSLSGGTFTATGAGPHSVNFAGTNKTFAQPGAGTLTNTNLNWSVALGASLSLNSDFPVASARTLSVNGTLNCGTNAVTGAGAFTTGSTATLGIGSANGIDTGSTIGNIRVTGTRTFNSATSYNYNGSVNQAVGNGLPSSVANLTIANTGGGGSNTVTGNSGQTVTGLLRVQSGVYAGASAYNNVQIDSGATLTLGADSTVSGNWTNDGTFNNGGFTVTFNGTSAQSIGGTSTTSFANLTDSNTSAAVTFNTNFDVSGTFNMNGAGTLFTPGSPTVQINSAGNVGTITGSGEVKVTRLGSNSFSGQYRFSTFSVTSLTVNWAGAGDQGVENGVSGYGSIKTSGSGTKSMGGSVTLPITNDVTVGAGTTFAIGLNNLTINGNLSNAGTLNAGSGTTTLKNAFTNTGTFNKETSTIFYDGTGQTIIAVNYYNLTFSNNSKTLASSGTIGIAGTFTPGTSTSHTINFSTVEYNGTSAQALPSGFQTYENLRLNNSAGTSGFSGLKVNDTLTVVQGTFTSASDYHHVVINVAGTLSLSGPITVSGDWTNSGTFTHNNNSVTFDGTGAQTITTGGSGAGKSFAGFLVNKASGTATLAGDLGAQSVSVTAGTFDQGTSFGVTTSGAGTVATVGGAGRWTNFGTGDLALSGNVTNSGTIEFNANGTGCNEVGTNDVSISSTGAARTWSGTGTFSMTDVTVANQSSAAPLPPITILVNSGTNGGGNTGWTFVDQCTAGTYTWIGGTVGVNTDWQVSTNWNPTRVTPAAGDVLIFDGTSTPAPTVTNVPTQTISSLQLKNSVNAVKLNAAVAGPHTLTVTGNAGLDVQNGSRLEVLGSTGLTIAVTTGSGSTINGQIALAGGPHHLTGQNAGQIIFSSTGLFAAGTTSPASGFTGNPFGAGTTDSVRFQDGSNAFFNEGSSPFATSGGVVTFTSASNQEFNTSTAWSAEGRFYGNLTLASNQIYFDSSAATQVTVGGNLTIANGSTLKLADFSGGDLNLWGNFTDNGTFDPNGRTVKFQGGAATQTVFKNGAAEQFFNVLIGKIGGSVQMLGDVTINGALQFEGLAGSAIDVLDINSNFLTLNGTVGSVPDANSGLKGNLNGSVLIITGTGALGTVNFVSGGQEITGLQLNRSTTVPFGTNLTIGQPSGAPFGSLDLVNGIVDMGANTLTLNPNVSNSRTNGYVSGNLKRVFAAASTFTFHVGTANGYSQVGVNVTGNTFPSSLTVKAVQGQHPNIAGANALQRYWTLTETGDLQADLTFNWRGGAPAAGDVVGTESSYKIFKYTGSFEQIEPDVLDTVNHFATKNGVSSFSDWTLAELSAVNAAPVIEDPGTLSINTNETKTFDVFANDADALQSLSFSVQPGDGGCPDPPAGKFNSISFGAPQQVSTSPNRWKSVLTINSMPNSQGNYTKKIRVSDGTAETFFCLSIQVSFANTPPTLSVIDGDDQITADEPSGAQANTQTDFALSASDVDSSQTLSFTIVTPVGTEPACSGATVGFAGASIIPGTSSPGTPPSASTGTATLRITAGPNDAGTYCVGVRASDGTNGHTRTVQLIVNAANSSPAIEDPGTLNLNENETKTFDIFATDPDALQSLSFSVQPGDGGCPDPPAGKFNSISFGAPQQVSTSPNRWKSVLTINSMPSSQGSYTKKIQVSDSTDAATFCLSISVAPPPAETDVSLSGGNLIITDGNGGTSNDTLTISLVSGNIRVNDPSNSLTCGAGMTTVDANTCEVAVGDVTGNIQVNTLAGNDTLTLDLTGGDFIPAGGLSYAGGDPPTGPGDKLILTGGSQGTVTYNYTNASDGNIVMSNFGTVSYTGLEPITNSGDSTDTIFNLPSASNVATLSDLGGGSSRLSSTGTFEQTDFANPSNSLTITGGAIDDVITVQALATNYPSLTINGNEGDDVVNLNGNISFASNANLDVDLQNDDPTPGTDSVSIGTNAQLVMAGTGAATVKVSKNITLASGSKLEVADGNLTLEANQQATPTTGNFRGILLTNAVLKTTGTGSISLIGKAGADAATPNHMGIQITSGSSVSSTQATAGAGTITLNGVGAAGTQSNRGVEIALSPTVVTSVVGDISLTGTAGTGGSNNYGVSLLNGATVSSTGAAKITIDGTGGSGTTSSVGARVSGEDTQLTSAGGDISISGQGGSGASGNHHGVSIAFGALVSATSGAKIIVDGTGGSGGSNNAGAIVSQFGPTNLVATNVTSNSGDIQFTGQGGSGTGFGQIGWNIDSKATVVATGSANISIDGTGGSGASDNYGVGFEGGSEVGTGVSAVNGNIIITGVSTEATGTSEDGVRFEDSVGAQAVLLSTSGTGTVTITGTAGNTSSAGIHIVDDCSITLTGATNTFIADSMDFGTSNVSVTAGANALTLRQKTNGISIDLGGADSAVQLGLTDTELDLLSAGALNIGDGNSGTLTVSANITRSATTNMALTSDGDVAISGGQIDTGGGTLLLDPGASPDAVKPTNSLTDVTASTLSIGSDLGIVINGTTVDTGYTQLNVVGSVDLTGDTLALSGTHVPANGQQFIIVNNDDTDAVTGTFAGVTGGTDANGGALAEGDTITNFLGASASATITYLGGDGNDVVLTVTVACTTPATPTASNGGPYCEGATIQLNTPTVSGATYSWTGPNGFTSSDQNPTRANATTADAGTYFVTITVSGCTSAAGSTTVVVNPTPATPTATNGGPYCEGGTIQLNTPTVSGATYSWTGPGGFTSSLQNPTRANATLADAGTYSVTVTVNGCTSAAGTTDVVVNATPATPTATNTGPYCEGGTIQLNTPTVSGATYSWTGPGGFTSSLQNPTRASATLADAGTYSVTVTVNGCTSAAGTTDVVVNATPATPTASNDGPYCEGATIQLSTPTVSGATYAWTGPNGFTSSDQNPTRANATTADAGDYFVTVTVNGCPSAAGSTNVVVSTCTVQFAQANTDDTETNSSSHSVNISVTRGGGSYSAVDVTYTVTDGTATTADGDYSISPATGTLHWDAGDSTPKNIVVTVNGDTKFEPDETVNLALSSPTGATLGTPSSATLTILNDDTQPTISIDNLSINEGNSSTTAFNFTVSLSNASHQTITVNAQTADDSATTADSDYTGVGSTLITFNPGETSKPFQVLANGDTKYELDDRFFVNLTGETNATIADGQGDGTILNDDTQPTISIDNLSINEGNSSTTAFNFTVSLSNASYQTITVNAQTADDSATTADSDYTGVGSTTLTFTPDTTSQPFQVLANGDTKYELDDRFFVNLTGETNATIADGQGDGTILNDDTQPTISIDNLSINEGNSSTTAFNFTVSLSNASYQTITVNAQTADDSATTADLDYTGVGSTTLTFTPDTTSQQFQVLVNGDTKYEHAETFFVNLSGETNATIADGQGLGTINNEDAAPTLLFTSAPNDTEGTLPAGGTKNFVFNVHKFGNTGVTATVDYQTFDGPVNPATGNPTAACGAGFDYQHKTASLSFAPGETDKTITILVCRDAVYEANEVFLVTLSSPVDAQLSSGDETEQGRINNDDSPPSTLTVNTTADHGVGACDPLSTGDCTLREAIAAANASTSAITINFDIPASDSLHFYYADDNGGSPGTPNGTVTLANVTATTATDDTTIVGIDPDWAHSWWSIRPDAAFGPLPTITQTVVIDGYTQCPNPTQCAQTNTSATSTNAVLRIELDGENATAGVAGLTISSGFSIVRGLVINRVAHHGITLQSGGSDNLTGNFIGTDVSGTLDLGSVGSGVNATSSSHFLGGSTRDLANLISGNGDDGATFTNSNSNIVQGNYIGTKANGTAVLGNGGNGIRLTGAGSLFNTIGGVSAGEANTIAFNGADGVSLSATGNSNTIRGNSIFSNGTTTLHLGIDLDVDGVTANDPLDPDVGPNKLQNFPIIRTALAGTPNRIRGTLNSEANQTYTIDVYANTACDTSGNGEGKKYLGSTTADTGANGDALWSLNPTTLNAGEFITATATDSAGNTSEFSACFQATGLNTGTAQFVSAPYTDGETNADHTVTITVSRTGGSNLAMDVTYQTSDGSATLADNDYVAASGTLHWNNGETGDKTFTITVKGDTIFEGNETVNITLSGATISGTNPTTLTITNDDPQPTLSINDVSLAEGNGGTTSFIFTVTKTNHGAVSVNFQTQNGTATLVNSDYQSNSGSLSWTALDTTPQTVTVLVNGDTTGELDETFSVVLSGEVGATLADSTGVGTILNDDESVGAGQLIISEFRLSGPGANATEQANNEFIELYNNTNQDLLVTTTDGSTGWAVANSSGVSIFFVPNGTTIPARGHFLGTNTNGYSLNTYPAGDGNFATGNATWTTDVPNNSALAVFRTNNAANFNAGSRLDSVGPNTESNTLYREGTGYAPLAPADLALNLEHTFFRQICVFQAGCPTPGRPRDTQDNAADFIFADTLGTATSAGQRLGSPGPENLASPIKRDPAVNLLLLDASVAESSAPNRDRNSTSDSANASQFGTMKLRRRIVNQTGGTVTRLRFRVIDITTHPSGPFADLRLRSSSNEMVSSVNDANSCAVDSLSAPCTLTVKGMTLEQPPNYPAAIGAGMNSTLTVTLPGGGLPNGQSINVNFLLGVQKTGQFRFFLVIEALP